MLKLNFKKLLKAMECKYYEPNHIEKELQE